ncbi:MAG TPA: M56 family metallopeptidase [Steroidobacteraceae bacterium]|nr:M56 family metallopeptidase [Steroidobacteraceae bacterium]
MLMWAAYLMMIAVIVSVSAFALERIVLPYGFATRWMWVGALAASLVFPLVLSAMVNRPSVIVTSSASQQGAVLGTSRADARWVPIAPLALPPVASASERFDSAFEIAWLMSSLAVATTLLGGSWYGNRCRRYWKRSSIGHIEILVARDAGPATIGILHPQIVIPEWLLAAAPSELDLVIAHERSHIEARDNLLLAFGLGLAILMPWNVILWWQVRRLRLAIEVDCDRRVLLGGNDARCYAKTLIAVSLRRSTCLVGLSAAPRSISSIERRLLIMHAPKMNGWRASSAALAVLSVGVVAACFLITPPAMPLAMAGMRGGVVPATSSRYVGTYKMSSISVMRIGLRKGQLFAMSPGAPPQKLTRLSGHQYRFGQLDAYVRFAVNSAGHVTGLVFQQNGAVTEAPRIGAAGVEAVEKLVAERVHAQTATAGTETALRHLILGIQSGQPDYSELSPQLAAGTRAMLHHLQATLKPLGALRSVVFRGVNSLGWDRYVVQFQHGTTDVDIALDAYGVVVGAGINAAPQKG